MTDDVVLPSRLDGPEAQTLVQTLNARRGTAIHIEGSDVKFCGALGLQVLVAAQKQWRADGHALTLNASPDLLSCCTTLGVDFKELDLLPDTGELA
ncbi:STAS domain-containing protein [Roseovarius phycicola]|uniref:STAS domain-containing protein n=1 Tax=Roseovarius phycicola TaxID=3080976 RepID=A0ABZ2HM25_9RHOB